MRFTSLINFLRLGDDAEDPQVAMKAIESGVVFRPAGDRG